MRPCERPACPPGDRAGLGGRSSKATGSSPSPAGSALARSATTRTSARPTVSGPSPTGHHSDAERHLADRLAAGGREQRQIAAVQQQEKHRHRDRRQERNLGRRKPADTQREVHDGGVERQQHEPVEGGRAEPPAQGRDLAFAHDGHRRVRRGGERRIERQARVGRSLRHSRGRWRAAAGSVWTGGRPAARLAPRGRTSGSSAGSTSPNSGRSLAPDRDAGGTPGSSDSS